MTLLGHDIILSNRRKVPDAHISSTVGRHLLVCLRITLRVLPKATRPSPRADQVDELTIAQGCGVTDELSQDTWIGVPSAALPLVDDGPCGTSWIDVEVVTDDEKIRKATSDAVFRIYCPDKLRSWKSCKQNPGDRTEI